MINGKILGHYLILNSNYRLPMPQAINTINDYWRLHVIEFNRKLRLVQADLLPDKITADFMRSGREVFIPITCPEQLSVLSKTYPLPPGQDLLTLMLEFARETDYASFKKKYGQRPS
jgi:hypothetical protein